MDNNYKLEKLEYTIHKYSSFSGDFSPHNITVNEPTNQTSRWFTDHTDQDSQYIMIKINVPSIVHNITFGKYIKAHVSNLKKFSIYGGMEETVPSLLFTGGLNNDNISETFGLRHHTSDGLCLPVQYIKIVPQQSWGPAYNYTIWFVQLHGVCDVSNKHLNTINLRKEEECVRLLLKHLRRHHYRVAYEALSQETGVSLEGSTQSKLWTALVEQGDYVLTENIIMQAAEDGEFDWYLSWQPFKAKWDCISQCSSKVQTALLNKDIDMNSIQQHNSSNSNDVSSTDRDWPTQNGNADDVSDNDKNEMLYESCSSSDNSFHNKPRPRGGHQLVVDSEEGALYLFGGWDGIQDLDDLWRYDIDTNSWVLLCGHSSVVGGPSPRSCHKMVLDTPRRKLYTLGRYLDSSNRQPENMKSDLYVYDITSGEWCLLCEDTVTVGGPRLVFDHQICIDTDTATIYVFGGRVLPSNIASRKRRDNVEKENSSESTNETTEQASNTAVYSGLYAYYVNTNSWEHIQTDHKSPDSRVGHFMLFHPTQRRLYLCGGQSKKEQLVELWWYEVDARKWMLASSAPSWPAHAGFTQRATLDHDNDRILVLSGLSKEKERRFCNSLWVYSLRRGTWSCCNATEDQEQLPAPRFAHQLVYEPSRRQHYLFGGNPGLTKYPRIRLDDLWTLTLERMPREYIVNKAKVILREARYRHMANKAAQNQELGPSVAAVKYLHEDLHSTIDHSDKEQVERFRRLPLELFVGESKEIPSRITLNPTLTRKLSRRKAESVSTNITNIASNAAKTLACVIGANDMMPPQPQPWDDGGFTHETLSNSSESYSSDEEIYSKDDSERAKRIDIYDELSKYFRPSTVHPTLDVNDFIAL